MLKQSHLTFKTDRRGVINECKIGLKILTIILMLHLVVNACTVISYSNHDRILVGRNWDFYDQSNKIQFIPEGNQGPAMILFFRKHYVTDGINQHGLSISFTGVPNVSRSLVLPFKRWSMSIHVIRHALKKCRNTNDAITFFKHTSILWGRPLRQQIAFLVADSSGNSCIVDYVDKRITITEKKDDILVLLNQHPTRLDIGYKGFGCGLCERDSIIKKSFESTEIITEKKIMSVLSEVSISDGTVKGLQTASKVPWGCNTGFSNVYNLKKLTVSTVVNRNYEKPVSLNLHNLMGKCKNPIKINLGSYYGEESIIIK